LYYFIVFSIALQGGIDVLARVVVRPSTTAPVHASATRDTDDAHTREAAVGLVRVLQVIVTTVRPVVTGAAIRTAVIEASSDPVVAQ
jgi:hypothetical protein